jgi:hypothetical protein
VGRVTLPAQAPATPSSLPYASMMADDPASIAMVVSAP